MNLWKGHGATENLQEQILENMSTLLIGKPHSTL